jgi:tetratricopeptide (TPR) repeat protein
LSGPPVSKPGVSKPGSGLPAAIAAHKAGRLAEAAAGYERILATDPRNADALHLLGVLRLAQKDAAAAAELIGRAIAVQGRVAVFHVNLGRALQALGRADDAMASLRRAVKLSPADSAAWMQVGLAARARGNVADAVEAFRHAALAAPQDIAVLNNLAAALIELGRADEAQPAIVRALALDADNAFALGNEGQALLLQKRYAEAIAPLRRAAALMPGNVMALSNFGLALQEARQVDEALEVLRRAIALAPDNPTVCVSYGNVLKKCARYDEALAQFQRAIELRPDVAEVWSHIGTCHDGMMRYEAALACYDRAVALKPDYLRAQQNRAMTLLTLGRFKNGWRDYAARDKRPSLNATFLTAPHGEQDIAGRHVLLCGEQGIGDELLFLRFLAELRRRGAARVSYIANPKLAPLLGRLDGLDVVLSDRGAPPAADTVIAVGDLPLVLRMTSAAQIPPSIALPPLAARRAEIAARLAALGPPPYIGVTWRAGIPDDFSALFKVAPLAEIAATLAGLPGTLVAAQRLPDAGEIDDFAAAAGRPAHDMTALNDDLEGMLALLAQLDDYVAVSNTNVHLRAAAGRTSRVLIPCPPEFRWMAPREDFGGDESPWFPGSPVYRQTVERSWDGALATLRRDLLAAYS